LNRRELSACSSNYSCSSASSSVLILRIVLPTTAAINVASTNPVVKNPATSPNAGGAASGMSGVSSIVNVSGGSSAGGAASGTIGSDISNVSVGGAGGAGGAGVFAFGGGVAAVGAG